MKLPPLEKGSPVRVKGMGKCSKGHVTRDPDGTSITFRCNYHGGEHTVPTEKVRYDRTPIYKGK